MPGTLFVSDLHLDASRPQITRLFLDVLNTLHGKKADIVAQVAKADEIKGFIVKPHLVRRHPAMGRGVAAHAVVIDFDQALFLDRLVHAVKGLLKLLI